MDVKLTRRLFAVKVTAAGAALTGCVAPSPGIYTQPVMVPRGTGLTDADPSDGPGNGRGGYRPAYRGTGLTDADPADGPGNGRGGYRGGYRSGRTDSDPRDGVGRGRW